MCGFLRAIWFQESMSIVVNDTTNKDIQ